MNPIVTNDDRDWALAQKPAWAPLHNVVPRDDELVDDGGWLDAKQAMQSFGPSWFSFVIGEVEAFERFFSGQQKIYAEWSALWRKGWWPKRREDWTFKNAKRPLQPFFRAGTPEFVRALKAATKDERRIWQKFGIAQFKSND